MEKKEKKRERYGRIKTQLGGLLTKTDDITARMATIAAVLHHKMDGFFWTGFYIVRGEKLVVGPYQGPVACQELNYGAGVCWASVNRKETVIVDDVNKFPGHIACDSRSKSEIVVPVRNRENMVVAVLDADSNLYSNYDEVDAENLEEIAGMIFN